MAHFKKVLEEEHDEEDEEVTDEEEEEDDDEEAESFYLAMNGAKRLGPLGLLKRHSAAGVVRGLRFRSRFACLYTAEALQRCFYPGTNKSRPAQQALAALVKAGIVEATVEAVGSNPHATARKEATNWLMILIGAFPGCLSAVIEAGGGAALAKNASLATASRLREELDDENSKYFGAHQTDVIKPYASEEECKRYAPRYAAICAESIKLCLREICTAATLQRKRADLLRADDGAFAKLVVKEAVGCVSCCTSAYPCADGGLSAISGLAALVAPSLDRDVEGAVDADDVAEAILLLKTPELLDGLVKELETLVNEDPKAGHERRHWTTANRYSAALGFTSNPPAANEVFEEIHTRRLILVPLLDSILNLLDQHSVNERLAACCRRVETGREGFIKIMQTKLLSGHYTEAAIMTNLDELIEAKLQPALPQPVKKDKKKDGDDDASPFGTTAHIPPRDTESAALILAFLNKTSASSSEQLSRRVYSQRQRVEGNAAFGHKCFRRAARHYFHAMRLIGVHVDDKSDRSIIASNLAAALLRCSHHDKAALAAASFALELDPGNVKAKKRRETAEAKLAGKTHDRTLWTSDQLRRLLLEETPVGVDERALAKQRRVKEAASNSSLQETAADRSKDLKIRDTEGQDELIIAAMGGNTRALKRCLREGKDPNVQCNMGTKDTPLMLAACYTHLECAKLLIQQGACARMETWSGKSALGYATQARQGSEEDREAMVKLITKAQLDQGPHVLVKPDISTE